MLYTISVICTALSDTHTYAYMHTYICVHTHTHMNIYTCTYILWCTLASSFLAKSSLYIHNKHTHTHTHTHRVPWRALPCMYIIHTHTHTHTHRVPWRALSWPTLPYAASLDRAFALRRLHSATARMSHCCRQSQKERKK